MSSAAAFHVLFHSIARVRSSRVRAPLSLPLPLPLKGRGCDARDVAGSRLPFVRPHLAPFLFPLSLSLSRPRSLACSLPFPIQSSEAFPDRVTQRSGDFFGSATFLQNISRLSFSVLPTFLEFRKPVSCSEFLPPESKQSNQKQNLNLKSARRSEKRRIYRGEKSLVLRLPFFCSIALFLNEGGSNPSKKAAPSMD